MTHQRKNTGGTCTHLVDDAEIEVRVFQRGTRQLGEPCRLTLALNGDERMTFDEDAGDRAPRELVIDIRTKAMLAETVLQAMLGRPWAVPDGPVIIFTRPEAEGSIAYLVRNAEVSRVLEVVRDALDIQPTLANPETEFGSAHTRLDAAAGGG